jgi:hypothetical protein
VSPQVPQLGLTSFGVHAPLQTIWPVGHAWHWPLTQFCPPAHARPQPPQLFGSVATLVQVAGVPQEISPVGQAPHTPPAHGAPMGQAFPHAPQLFGSVISLAQTPMPAPAVPIAQSVSPAGHAQCPETHEAPWSQTKPHEPQLLTSVVVSVQPLEQLVKPVLQTQVGLMPPGAWQVEPVGQTFPHAPQLKSSVDVFVHVPGLVPLLPQTMSPVGQPHLPAKHVPLDGHTVPQLPQSVVLDCRLSQPSGQVVVPVGQPQTPAVQVAPCAHFIPHWLQLAGSVIVLVHTLLQTLVMPAGHSHVPFVQAAPCGQTVPHAPQLLVSASVLVHVPLQSSGVPPPHGPVSATVPLSIPPDELSMAVPLSPEEVPVSIAMEESPPPIELSPPEELSPPDPLPVSGIGIVPSPDCPSSGESVDASEPLVPVPVELLPPHPAPTLTKAASTSQRIDRMVTLLPTKPNR